jgi:hypothetical protein
MAAVAGRASPRATRYQKSFKEPEQDDGCESGADSGLGGPADRFDHSPRAR